MVRYGIGQIDYNLRTQIALLGLSKTPERDIADLLESGQPIEAVTRSRLAEALRGLNGSASLQLKATPAVKQVRRLKLHLERIAIGRLVISHSSEIGYGEAIKLVSREARMGKKSVEGAHTFAMKASKWVREVREKFPELSTVEENDLDAAFALGGPLGFDSDKVPHRLAHVREIAVSVRETVDDAYGPRGFWFMPRKTDDHPPKG